MSRHQDYITLVRQATKNFWNSVNEIESLKQEWNPGDYSNTLEDGLGDNDGITKAEINAVVNTSIPAIKDFINNNFHNTNLVKLL